MEGALRSSLRSRPEMGVATWLGWVRPSLVGVRSRPENEVVTWSALVRKKRCRDMDLMSRHGRQCGRSQHGFRCHDLKVPLWAGRRSRHENDVAT